MSIDFLYLLSISFHPKSQSNKLDNKKTQHSTTQHKLLYFESNNMSKLITIQNT